MAQKWQRNTLQIVRQQIATQSDLHGTKWQGSTIENSRKSICQALYMAQKWQKKYSVDSQKANCDRES